MSCLSTSDSTIFSRRSSRSSRVASGLSAGSPFSFFGAASGLAWANRLRSVGRGASDCDPRSHGDDRWKRSYIHGNWRRRWCRSDRRYGDSRWCRSDRRYRDSWRCRHQLHIRCRRSHRRPGARRRHRCRPWLWGRGQRRAILDPSNCSPPQTDAGVKRCSGGPPEFRDWNLQGDPQGRRPRQPREIAQRQFLGRCKERCKRL